MRLEIGCGKKPRTGFSTCDIRNLPHVDFVCSADNLPFQKEEIDEIYSRHLIEHFTLKEFLKVLNEWNRVLKKEGELYIICPNLLWHLKQIVNGEHHSFYSKKSDENQRYWGLGSLFGWQQDEFDVHKFGYYFELIKDILEDAGFDQVEDLTASGKGLENQPWHLEVRARKKHNSPDYRESKFYHHFNVGH